MKYVTFKDRNVYSKIPYTSIHRLMWKNDTHIAIELELLHEDSSWSANCPFEHEFKIAEENKNTEFLNYWNKQRKWQKRKIYTIEEFNNLFEPLSNG